MPVRDEAEGLPGVVAAWTRLLGGAGIDYELLAYDDGSRDDSLALLRAEAAVEPRVVVRHHDNRGHGPTVLRGYREARGRWVLQIDSDDELPAEPFLALWARREGFDLLLARRVYASRPPGRALVSRLARTCVGLLFGGDVTDPNAPFRLMRRDWLAGVLPQLPPDAFAPNVMLCGLAARSGARVLEVPVAARPRTTGAPSLSRGALWRGAARSFWQTARLAGRRR